MKILNNFKGNSKDISIEEYKECHEKYGLKEYISAEDIFNYFWQYNVDNGTKRFCHGYVDALIEDEEIIVQAIDVLISFYEHRAKCNGLKLEEDIYKEWHKCSESLVVSSLQDFYSEDYQQTIKDELSNEDQAILTHHPKLCDIVREKDQLISEETLCSCRERIQEVITRLKDHMKANTETAVRSFLYYLEDNGVSFNNQIDRDAYEILDIFGYIPTEVKHRHNTQSTTTDPFSNYISSFRKKKWKV